MIQDMMPLFSAFLSRGYSSWGGPSHCDARFRTVSMKKIELVALPSSPRIRALYPLSLCLVPYPRWFSTRHFLVRSREPSGWGILKAHLRIHSYIVTQNFRKARYIYTQALGDSGYVFTL